MCDDDATGQEMQSLRLKPTRVYAGHVDSLQRGEALAACGECGRTIVVMLDPSWFQEFYYCTNRGDCEQAKQRKHGPLSDESRPPVKI